MGHLRALHQGYGDRASFLFVYISEAGHSIPEQDEVLKNAGLPPAILRTDSTDDPQEPTETPQARSRRLVTLLHHYDLRMPCLLDTDQKEVQQAYSAWPQRLVLIDRHGRVAWDGGWGVPNGLDYDAAEEQMRLLLAQDECDYEPAAEPHGAD